MNALVTVFLLFSTSTSARADEVYRCTSTESKYFYIFNVNYGTAFVAQETGSKGGQAVLDFQKGNKKLLYTLVQDNVEYGYIYRKGGHLWADFSHEVLHESFSEQEIPCIETKF